jgi:hypothetical protein
MSSETKEKIKKLLEEFDGNGLFYWLFSSDIEFNSDSMLYTDTMEYFSEYLNHKSFKDTPIYKMDDEEIVCFIKIFERKLFQVYGTVLTTKIEECTTLDFLKSWKEQSSLSNTTECSLFDDFIKTCALLACE